MVKPLEPKHTRMTVSEFFSIPRAKTPLPASRFLGVLREHMISPKSPIKELKHDVLFKIRDRLGGKIKEFSGKEDQQSFHTLINQRIVELHPQLYSRLQTEAGKAGMVSLSHVYKVRQKIHEAAHGIIPFKGREHTKYHFTVAKIAVDAAITKQEPKGHKVIPLETADAHMVSLQKLVDDIIRHPDVSRYYPLESVAGGKEFDSRKKLMKAIEGLF